MYNGATASAFAFAGHGAPVGGSNEARPPGDHNRLGPAGRADLAEDVRDVDAGGLLGDEEVRADLPVRAAVRQQLKDFALAHGQAQPSGPSAAESGAAVGTALARLLPMRCDADDDTRLASPRPNRRSQPIAKSILGR
jgi:hypothetical protein